MSGLTNDSEEWLFQQGIRVKWEYKIVKLGEKDFLNTELAKVGREGWEVFHIKHVGDTIYFTAKRREA